MNTMCLINQISFRYRDYLLVDGFRDLGAHIDGFIAVVAHTIVIGGSQTRKVTGRKADVVLAAHYASQAALRLLKPGTEVGFPYPLVRSPKTFRITVSFLL